MKEQGNAILLGDWGTELTVIECGAARDSVIVKDDSGDQVMSEVGVSIRINQEDFPGASESCPLTQEPASRTVGQFVACSSCCLSWLGDANGPSFI